MKQNITPYDLSTLPATGKELSRLSKWCKEKEYSLELSIGQMIEFLGDNWEWEAFGDPDNMPLNEELCDTLWTAVKEVLSND